MACRNIVLLALLALLATSTMAQDEKDQCQTCKDLVNATRQVRLRVTSSMSRPPRVT